MHGHRKEITPVPGTVRVLNTHFFQAVYHAQDLLAWPQPENIKSFLKREIILFEKESIKNKSPSKKYVVLLICDSTSFYL